MKIIVLGGGLVGGPMARDLAADPEFAVTVADRDEETLAVLAARAPVTPLVADLADPGAVTALVAEFDLVVGAVPGHMGYRTLEAVLRAGRNVVDIAFFPEDPFGLDSLAREHGATAVVDCGVFPGMGSALIGRLHRKLDHLEDVQVLVGGLPEVRQWPWDYRAVFSPVDVIEEYTRPARYLEHGRLVVRPALSDVELVDFPGVGTLEAFNTDGLRTLAQTVGAPNMKEKTLRYPGHAEKMLLLRECGFFGTEPVAAGAARVRPLDVTAALLFPMWELKEGEGDLTVMRIEVRGTHNDQRVVTTYDLLDRYDHESGVSSMARTTGYTATVMARLLAEGRYARPGVSAPEHVGMEFGCVDYLLKGLAERGVVYRERFEVLG